MSVGMASSMAVHLVRWLFGELIGYRAVVIVMTRVNLQFGDTAVR